MLRVKCSAGYFDNITYLRQILTNELELCLQKMNLRDLMRVSNDLLIDGWPLNWRYLYLQCASLNLHRCFIDKVLKKDLKYTIKYIYALMPLYVSKYSVIICMVLLFNSIFISQTSTSSLLLFGRNKLLLQMDTIETDKI